MVVALLSLELHFAMAQSLKDKRMVLHGIKDRIRKHNVAMAEVEHQELWQRAGLTVACAASGHRELQELLDAVVRYLGAQEYELMRAEREVVVPGDS
jgi:uncharacterized protein